MTETTNDFNTLPPGVKENFFKKVLSGGEKNREEQFELLRRDRIKKPVIFIGAGTCGLGAGAGKTKKKILEYLDTNKLDADVIDVGCIGYCSAEPLIDVQLPGKCRISFQHITQDKVDNLLDEMMNGKIPLSNILGQHKNEKLQPWKNIPFIDEHPFFAPQKRWVLKNCGLIDPGNIDEYVANGGYKAFIKTIHTRTPDEACTFLEKSLLRGRGGGGFPAGKKLRITLNQKAETKYMVCNADEGDPGAFMDRAVIEGDPHKLLEGLAIASYIMGASKAYIYIRAEYPLAIQRLKDAIQQARDYNFIGENILDSGYSLNIVIKMGAGAFVCGEETALIHSIEGKRGMPGIKPPFPSVKGIFGKPTTVNNVETLANLPTIFSNTLEWFKSAGTKLSSGTKVFALSGKVNRTGLVEVEIGTTVREIVYDIGGGIPGGLAYKAVQTGGPSGGCIPLEHIDIKLDYESLKEVGTMMGSGGMVVMDEKTCMVDIAKFFMDFIQRESCGKCIPCREGTKRMLDILKSITSGRKTEKKYQALERFRGVIYLTRLAEVIKSSSLCGLGQSAPNPILSTLRWFRDEYESHIYDRKCPAGVCEELLTYSIDSEKCIGCGACLRKCPTGAIIGEKKAAHQIIESKCIGCGNCLQVCRFDAVKAE